jgi:hypothetical protein
MIYKYIASLPEETLDRILADYELLEEQGFIGECVLRKVSAEMREALNIPQDANITLWMREVYIAAGIAKLHILQKRLESLGY